MADVKFKRGTQQELDAMPIIDGQLLYNIEIGYRIEPFQGFHFILGLLLETTDVQIL